MMDSSLTTLLESSPGPLSLVSQVDICYDVSLALSYIHSIGIMHRDVTSNNVLIKGITAKLTDFGASVEISSHDNLFAPGSQCYMPPEALTEPVNYGCKLDCFSFGVLIVQIISRQWPQPDGDVNNFDNEIKRRRKHIDSIDPSHPLLSTALQCLNDLDTNRPTASALCQVLSDLKQSWQYSGVDRQMASKQISYSLESDSSNSASSASFSWQRQSSYEEPTPPPPEALHTPTMKNHQVIGDLILSNTGLGSGAFGSVFKATYRGKDCAAKMLSNHARDLFRGMRTGGIQAARKECILRECEFLPTFQHENVIQHITTIIEPCNELPILVMEIMDCNLKRYIREERPLHRDSQLIICHGVACGLEYLHTSDIIHRDLCDDNVLLKREPHLTVKISDFGMSKILDYDSMSATITAVGHRKGYLPPEGEGPDTSDEEDGNYDNKAYYSHRLDMYSFGAVATQTVQSADQFLTWRDLNQSAKRITEKHPLKPIITQCLSKDSKSRPSAKVVSECIKAARVAHAS